MLAPLDGRIYDHVPHQNAFPLGIEGEIMARMGYWAPVIAASLILVTLLATRHRLRGLYPGRFLVALSLLCLGMIIGPLPWALNKGSDSLRSAASMISIAASCSAILVAAVVLVERWRRAGTQRHDA